MRTFEEKFLLQYKYCTDRIFELLAEAKEVPSLQGIDYTKDRVQTSHKSSPTEIKAMRLEEIDCEIKELFEKRSQVEQTIKEIENPIEQYILDNFARTGSFKSDVFSARDVGKHKQNALAHLHIILEKKEEGVM